MDKKQRLVLVIAILASFVVFLDGAAVSLGLPAIGRELDGGLTLQQWVINAYLLTLGSLILVAGSLSDLFGRRKVLAAGLVGFATTSLLCALAPTGLMLIVARALQGVAGALLVPSSLALIISTFSGAAQGRAIGYWTGWTGIAFVIGPLLGGFLVDAVSWRLVFAIYLVPIAVTLWLLKSLEVKEEIREKTRVDTPGALLAMLGLGGTVYALIEQSHYGWSSPQIWMPFVGGLAALGLFLWHEWRAQHPMLPLGLFKVRNFSVGNVATLAIYGGLSVATFLIAIFAQQVGGYSALAAGMTLLPVMLIMFVFSPRFGMLAGKFGPRIFMAVGPLIAGLGFLAMLRVSIPLDYWTQLLPGMVLFGVGLSVTVAPLTAAVLGSIQPRQAGIASATNNAIARIAGLLAIAGIGLVTGPELDLASFHRGITVTAGLLVLGGIVSAVGIRKLKQ